MKNNIIQFLFGSSLNQSKIINAVWLLFRLHIGLSLASGAGLPKMQEGLAPAWFVKQVGELGFTFISPTFWATVASWGEFVGGVCIALGLLTRFSSLQLAFQFFVIAFIWYENPGPILGMYFQQTLFWCYVLTAFIGGGKYSLDNLIMNKKFKKNAPLPKAAIASLFFIFVSIQLNAQPLNGSGNIIRINFQLKNFDKVAIKDVPGVITIEVGKPFSIETEVDDNLASLLDVTEQNGELQIKFKQNENNKLYIEETKVKIKICVPEVSVVKHNANSNLMISGILGRYFKIKNSDNGNVILKGTIDELNITCTGNGLVNAIDVSAKKIEITKRGNGNVYIDTNEPFTANGSGNGDIINTGKGKATSNSIVTGNGEVKYAN